MKLERYRHFGVPEYWIVDLEGRAVEVWRLAAGAQRPEVVPAEGRLGWTPASGGSTLDVGVSEIVSER